MKPKELERRPVLPVNAPVVIEGIDGRQYPGKTLRKAIEAMRRGSWGMPARNLNGYMRQVAKRVYGWNKCIIRTNGIKNFVADLVAAGVIVVHINK